MGQSVECPREAVRKLNEQVDALNQAALKKVNGDVSKLSIDYQCALRPKTFLKAGAPIYEERSRELTYLYWLGSVAALVSCTVQLGLGQVLLMGLLCFVEYDIFSGMLHVVFDHPDNINLPILGQPCLEFQWHHLIPDDIVKRDFVYIAGDLNVATGLISVAVLCSAGLSPLVQIVVAWKILMATFGQFSHRSSHEISRKKRGPIVMALQKAGIIISVGDHHKHHTPPHDTNFCLIGPCNVLLEQVLKISRGRYFWLVLFVSWVFACVPLLIGSHGAIMSLFQK
jgi:hypothetical protein